MSAQAAVVLMADHRKEIPFQIRCSPDWLKRVKEAADQLGLSAAAYIRQATTLKMDADGIPKPKAKKT